MRYGKRGRYPGNGHWSDVPPYQRPGTEAGYGMGYRRGYGLTDIDPTKCARFPWLQRWWWNNPDTSAQEPSNEKDFLEGQVTALSQELENLKKRLGELSTEETP